MADLKSDFADKNEGGERFPEEPYHDTDTSEARITGEEHVDGLRKTLKDRHLSMIALGGSLGTGLLVGT